MIEQELLRKINKGRCFVLIGAGPSCEMGYPSWAQLCDDLLGALRNQLTGIDLETYQKFLGERKYPELLRQAETDLGDREKLVDLIRRLLQPKKNGTDVIYNLLSNWPFACYLTTNFDDEIRQHLTIQGLYYSVLKNAIADLSLIRDGSSNLIVKIHGDLDDPSNAIITSRDYAELMHSGAKSYLRDRLKMLFQIFDVLVLGYSMTDPDVAMILESAKECSSPSHPIYFVTTGLTKGEIRELYERKNIRVVQYENHRSDHTQLKRMLAAVDKFVVRRRMTLQIDFQTDEDEIAAASAIFIYRSLFGFTQEQPGVWYSLIKGLALRSLHGIDKPGITSRELIERSPLKLIPDKQNLIATLEKSLGLLRGEELVEFVDNKYWLSISGKSRGLELEGNRKLQEDQAYGQFEVSVGKQHPTLKPKQITVMKTLFRNLLVRAFKGRGLAISSALCSQNSIDAEDIPEVFRMISDAASSLTDIDQRITFIQCAHDFLLKPTEVQRTYLMSISQGYFFYHLVGLDPSCSKFRIEHLTDTMWFFDSSVILPLLARGCYNHEFAKDFFERLRALGMTVFTTEKLLTEIVRHIGWANDFMKGKQLDSMPVLAAALGKEEYKQNLLVDASIRCASEGVTTDYDSYLREVFPNGVNPKAIVDLLLKHHIRVISVPDITNFDLEDWGSQSDLESNVRAYRMEKGTFRSDEQVSTEAEMLMIVRALRSGKCKLKGFEQAVSRAFFVSQSHVLDKVSKEDLLITWTPESLYRYTTSLPMQIADKDLLQQCMLQEYYYTGMNFIDEEKYLRAFGTTIAQSKLKFVKEKERYTAQVESQYRGTLDEQFNAVSDLEKPFFVAQMAWGLAEAAEAEARAVKEQSKKEVEEAKALVEKERAELRRRNIEREKQVQATLRQSMDPKHQKKRAKQAKRKKRKR